MCSVAKNIRYFVSPNCLQIRAVTLVKAFMAVDEFASVLAKKLLHSRALQGLGNFDLIINFCEGYES